MSAHRGTDVVSAEDHELARENERLRREVRILKEEMDILERDDDCLNRFWDSFLICFLVQDVGWFVEAGSDD